MDSKTHARFAARAEIVKALGHPTRLFVMDELAKGERCVCELVEMVGADFSTVSKHLAVLKNAGLVIDDKRGLKVFYRMRCPCLVNFFECIEEVLRTNARERIAVLR